MSMNQRKPKFLFVALVLIGHSACMVGPNYERPVVEVPDVWNESSTAQVVEGEAPLQTWWNVFEDPKLTEIASELRSISDAIRGEAFQSAATPYQVPTPEWP